MSTTAASLDIAHVVENLERGGLERMVIDLALAQRAAGHRPRVACLFAPGALADELRSQGVEVFACHKTAGLDLGAVRRLRAWLGAAPGTVVHTHNANAHYHSVAASFGTPVSRLLNTRHGMGAAQPRSRGEWLYRRSMWRTDVVAAVCEAARARFADQGVRPRARLLAVPNGIRVETFAAANAERRAALRNVLGLAPGTRIIGTVGRLNPVKDQATLLQAFARVHAEAADTALVLVGDGALRAELQALAGASGAGEAVHFLGDRGDVRQLLQGFDVFALSSRSEGYSMALLEACASGLPIVATDVGGNREIVADDRNGLIVPAADATALATALLGLLRDPARAQRLGTVGRDWALREASVQAMAARYEALYRGASG
ncbi:glycosyltransferase [Lysobacter brunescens]|uniref:Glycosyltransferase n=1 Tax=Lysobacter brunescens TaxID=262323 RepID=A0ABW2YCI2_9GAMM